MNETFADLGVPDDLVDALNRHDIRTPFQVERVTLADGCAGRDVCAQAPTGSGKTIAFGVPLAARLAAAAPHKPTGLVLVPTRELAAQVRRELEWLGAPRRLRTATLYGGGGCGGPRAPPPPAVAAGRPRPRRARGPLPRRGVRLSAD